MDTNRYRSWIARPVPPYLKIFSISIFHLWSGSRTRKRFVWVQGRFLLKFKEISWWYLQRVPILGCFWLLFLCWVLQRSSGELSFGSIRSFYHRSVSSQGLFYRCFLSVAIFTLFCWTCQSQKISCTLWYSKQQICLSLAARNTKTQIFGTLCPELCLFGRSRSLARRLTSLIADRLRA